MSRVGSVCCNVSDMGHSLRSYTNPHEQIEMILDTERMRVFADALNLKVGTSSVVLDIGSGSGILAVIAALAGARHVYAVENTTLAHNIARFAHDNGVADRITVLKKDAQSLTLDDFEALPTIVVAEVLGHFPASEDIHSLCSHAKSLLPNALFLPERYRLIATAVHSRRLARLEQLKNVQGVCLERLAAMAQKMPTSYFLDELEVAGEGRPGSWVPVAAPLPERYDLKAQAQRSFNALGVTWEAEFPGGERLRTELQSGHTHWRPYIFPVEPVTLAASRELSFRLSTRSNIRPFAWCWTVECGDMRSKHDAQELVSAGNVDELLKSLGLVRQG